METELSFIEVLQLNKALLTRLCELLDEGVDKDIARFNSLGEVDQRYVLAFWRKRIRGMLDATREEEITLPATNIDGFNRELELIEDYFGLSLTSATKCVDAVKNRLDSMKRLVGDRFVKEFKDAVNKNSISSPIEQLFLMEWKFSDLESRFNLDIEPQAEIATRAGTYRVDFLITSKSLGELETSIVIELDGHEFHEKSKEQVARDNKRVRALTQAGMSVLRFSGHELMGKSRDWMGDVIAMIEKSRTTVS
jgi:very-short-patch-repair endonuclease